jgi:SET and MYND domain-containing protein
MIGFGRNGGGSELGRNIPETVVSLEKELVRVWTYNTLQDY